MKTKPCAHCKREFETEDKTKPQIYCPPPATCAKDAKNKRRREARKRGTNILHTTAEVVPGIHAQDQHIRSACAAALNEAPGLRQGVETIAACIQGLSEASAAYLLAVIGLHLNEMATKENDRTGSQEGCRHDGNTAPGDHRE